MPRRSDQSQDDYDRQMEDRFDAAHEEGELRNGQVQRGDGVEITHYKEFKIIDFLDGQLAIRCKICDKVSYNHKDVMKRYCGNCHKFLES